MRIAPGDLVEREAAAKSASLEAANMVRINGGTFTMGSPAHEAGRDDDEIQHQVTVSTFYMGEYEVTQKEWREVMGNNPSHFQGDNLPVHWVTWYQAIEYCNKRSLREGLTPAYTRITHDDASWNRNANGYRLPTEAEWEYACRAGTTGPFNTGNNITKSQANYNSNYLYNVGSFAPNLWGLYDMHGNVREWCWDRYGAYTSEAQTNPIGASPGVYARILRGGSLDLSVRYLRSAARRSQYSYMRYNDFGFRVARNAE
jgi:formylglycine-generating enzyme required for sulfatase activity